MKKLFTALSLFTLFFVFIFFFACRKDGVNNGETSVYKTYKNPQELSQSLLQSHTFIELRNEKGETVAKEDGIRLVYFGVNADKQFFIIREEVVPVLETAMTNHLDRIIANNPNNALFSAIKRNREDGHPHKLFPIALLPSAAIQKLGNKHSAHSLEQMRKDMRWEKESFLAYYALEQLEMPPYTDSNIIDAIIYEEECYDMNSGKRTKKRICNTLEDPTCGNGSYCNPTDCYVRCVANPPRPDHPFLAVIPHSVFSELESFAKEDPEFWNVFLEKIASERYKNYQKWRLQQTKYTPYLDGEKMDIPNSTPESFYNDNEWEKFR